MASLRGNRKSSRTSSPFAAASTDPKKQERKQTSLDTWMEPSPRTPVPSFEDHGFERGGVVGNMAALGSLPPVSKQKLRINMTNRPTPITDMPLDTPEAASETPDVTSETMEVAPQTPVEIASRTPEGTPPPVEQAVHDVKEEQVKREFTPVGVQFAPRAAQSPLFQNGATTPSAHSHSRQQSQTSIATPPSAISHAVMAQAFAHTRSPSRTKIIDEAVVNSVVEIAHRQGHPSMGLAVKRIYDESRNNAELAILLDAVLLRNPTPEQNVRWAEEIKRHKKDIKREGKSAKRLQKSLQRNDPLNSFTSFSQPPPTMGTMGTIGFPMPSYSAGTTIGSSGSNTPPLPPSSLQTFHPQPFLASSPHFESRSITPQFNTLPNQNPNGAGTDSSDIMVSTRGQKRKADSESGPATTAIAAHITPALANGTSAVLSASATTSATVNQTPAGTGAISIQPIQPSVQPITAPKTRRTRKGRDATASATVTPDTQTQPLPPATSAAITEPPKPENGSEDIVPESSGTINGTSKIVTQPPTIAEPAEERTTRARSLSSTSNLSDVDEELIEGGNPSLLNSRPTTSGRDEVIEASLLDSPPPASGRNTPRLGVGPTESGKGKGGKGKHKKNASRSAVGSKRSHIDAGLDEPSPETAKRQKQVQDTLDGSLQARNSALGFQEVSDFRHSSEYAGALPVPRPSSPMRVFGSDTANYSSDTGSAHASSSRTSHVNASTTAPKGRASRTRRNIEVTAATTLEAPTAPSTPRSAHAPDGEPHAKRRKTARTKHSPVKQAMTRANGQARGVERDASPTGDNEMENSDVCFVCRKGGDLVCCDGCPNSVHPECWDPPCTSSEDTEFQQNPWHCQECRLRDALEGEADGPDGWGHMLGAEDYNLPGEFGLPEDVSGGFVGVEVNTEFDKVGNFKALNAIVPATVRNPAVPDIVDASKLIKDPNAMPVCYKCMLTSHSNSCPMIYCDDCKTPWHLDCLSPPLAHPPYVTARYVTNNRGQDKEVYQKEYWQCPLHVDGSLSFLTEPNNDISRFIQLRKTKKRKAQTAPNNGFGFYNTGDVEIDFAPEDAETGNAIYRVPEEALINNFMLKCTQRKVKQQKDVVGLINLLPPKDRREAEKIVQDNYNARVEEVVRHRMQLFKRHEDSAMQKTNDLPEHQRNFVLELAAFPAAVERKNLDLLVQAVDQVDAAQDTVATLSLDQISVLEQLLADAKCNLMKKTAEPASKTAEELVVEPFGRAQSFVSQATAAAEE